MMKQNPGKIRWGIMGTGWIAEQFATDLAYVENAQFVAVGSRTASSAGEFASKYDIPQAYGSYEELVRDPDVDVVYIATPHPRTGSMPYCVFRPAKPSCARNPYD